jgi:hypothetical protein
MADGCVVEPLEGVTKVVFHQSWVGDYFKCPERARRKLIEPEADMPNDATILGTAYHTGIEEALREETWGASLEKATDLMAAAFREPHVQRSTQSECFALLERVFRKWWEDVRPGLLEEEIVSIERDFSFPFGMTKDYQIWLEGRIDAETRRGVRDHKTSTPNSLRYWHAKNREKEIQGTTYSVAAVHDGTHTWPVRFRFDVVSKEDNPKYRPVEFTITARHADWLLRRLAAIADQVVKVGIDSPWPMHDDSFLCSETWCPFWGTCRGAHL